MRLLPLTSVGPGIVTVICEDGTGKSVRIELEERRLVMQ